MNHAHLASESLHDVSEHLRADGATALTVAQLGGGRVVCAGRDPGDSPALRWWTSGASGERPPGYPGPRARTHTWRR